MRLTGLHALFSMISLMRVQAIRFYKLMKRQKLAVEARRAQEAAERRRT